MNTDIEDDWELFDKLEQLSLDTSENVEYCNRCNSDEIELDSNNTLVCTNCGIILITLIDKIAEKTNSMSEGSTINYYLPKSSLGTTISGNRRMSIKQVTEWWNWDYKEKSFFEDKKLIEKKCQKAKLQQPIIDNALNLYKKISECRHNDGQNKGKYVIVRGINRIALMAASVYYGAKMQKQPRSPKELADVFGLKLPYMTRGCKKFLSLIDTNVLFNITENNESCDFVDRYCTKLGLDKNCLTKALEIIININKLQIATNHQPPSVAAAAILLMSDLFDMKINKKHLHQLFKISEVTIAKTYKKIYPWIRIVSDTNLTNEYYTDLEIEMFDKEEKDSNETIEENEENEEKDSNETIEENEEKKIKEKCTDNTDSNETIKKEYEPNKDLNKSTKKEEKCNKNFTSETIKEEVSSKNTKISTRVSNNNKKSKNSINKQQISKS